MAYAGWTPLRVMCYENMSCRSVSVPLEPLHEEEDFTFPQQTSFRLVTKQREGTHNWCLFSVARSYPLVE